MHPFTSTQFFLDLQNQLREEKAVNTGLLGDIEALKKDAEQKVSQVQRQLSRQATLLSREEGKHLKELQHAETVFLKKSRC